MAVDLFWEGKMNFFPYIPLEIPKNPNGLIANDKESLKRYWQQVEDMEEGLSSAIGIYIFGIRAGRGVVPWYVGKASAQGFYKECFQHHKLTHYNNCIAARKGTPVLTLIAKFTQRGYFAAANRNGHKDIMALEAMLIGTCLQRNKKLMNARDTKLFKEMVVPGFLNSPKGRDGQNVKSFKALIGS